MAQILNFQSFQTAKQFRLLSQQASDIVLDVGLLKAHISNLDRAVAKMHATHVAFCDNLSTHRNTLRNTLKLARSCSDACKLETVEEMVEARDKILRNH